MKSGRRDATRRSSASASFETPTNGEASTDEERHVVVAVLQQAEVHEQVDDLLLAEVALAGCAVRRQACASQLVLVPLGVGARREEEDDLARRRRAPSTSSRTRRATARASPRRQWTPLSL